MKRKNVVAMTLLLALIGGAAACSPGVEEPEVRLDGISVGGLGLEGGVLDVRVRVVNPNRFSLEASGLRYVMELASEEGDGDFIRFAEGDFREELRVGARDSAVVEIPVRFQYRDVGSAVRTALRQGVLDYRVSGSVLLEEPLRRTIPFRKLGTVEVFD